MVGTCRTVEKHGSDVELLDSETVKISSWRERGGAQRWLCVALPGRELQVFIPLEYFLERGHQVEIGQALIEG